MTRNSLINLMIVMVVILSAWGIAEPAGKPFQDGKEISSSTCQLYSLEVTEWKASKRR